ncbi:hypothetical protein D3C81_1751750 [compost metagenome]
MAKRKLNALLLINAPAEFAANVVSVGIKQVALARLGRNTMPFGVVRGADMACTEIKRVIQGPL